MFEMMKIRLGLLRKIIREELKVATYKGKSKVSGIGLFAGQFIPAGSIISKWSDGYDMKFSKDYPDQLSVEERAAFEKYASFDGDTWSLSGDDAKYFNHSEHPNVIVSKDARPPAERDRIAARDIGPGEELTMDYSEIGFDPI